ncbi:MAG: hypothetical protein M3539_18340, partial [Acidobacteriota bacterium]|nr:hypothetical protein [Acidobacteriota bacterium]
ALDSDAGILHGQPRGVSDALPQASNVETTFHMIKSKFGQRLRSKTMTAQINEALCKVLCHNLCVVIQSVHELGIETAFSIEAAA